MLTTNTTKLVQYSFNLTNFTNGTTVDSLSLIPSSGNPTNAWLLYQGTSMVDLDTPLTSPNNYNGMRSTFFHYDGVNNSITFNHN